MEFARLGENDRYRQIKARGRLAGNWRESRLSQELVGGAASRPDKVAIIDPDDRSHTYAELLARVNGFAAVLERLGVGASDRVALQMPNGFQFVVALGATNKLGATVAVVDTAYQGLDLDHILKLTHPKVAIARRSFRGCHYGRLYERVREGHPELSALVFDDELPQGQADASSRTFVGDNLDLLCFSSGTESVPKAVAHTDGTWMAGGVNVVEHVGLSGDDVLFGAAPFSHSIGLLELYIAIMLRATLVVQDRWDKAVAYERLQRYACSFAWGPPTFLRDITDQAAATGTTPSSLRAFLCGGANISPQLRLDAEARLGCRVHAFYGSTEVLGASMTGPMIRSSCAYTVKAGQ